MSCPDGGIEFCTGVKFFLVLGFQRVVGDGVEQSGTVNADGAFQPESHLAVGCRKGGIEGILGDGHLGIDEAVGLAVGETVAPFVGVAEPCDVDFLLVDGGLEGGHGLGLRHAGHRGLVGVGSLIVHYQQVAVGPVVGTVAFHAAAVAVAGMACFARRTDVEWSQTVEGWVVLRDGVLKEELAVFEGVGHAGIFYSGGGVFECRGGLVERGAQLSAGIRLFVNAFGQRRRYGVALATCKAEHCNSQKRRYNLFLSHSK